MKEKKKSILFRLLIIIMIIWALLLVKYYFESGKINITKTVTDKAVVISVYDNLMLCYSNNSGLCRVGLNKAKNMDFCPGQEIKIYFDGWIYATYPGDYSNVKKIKILKEESDIDIPDDILEYAYRKDDRVSIKKEEFTKDRIVLTMIDKNELTYNLGNDNKNNYYLKNDNTYEIGTLYGEKVYSGESIKEIFVSDEGTVCKGSFDMSGILDKLTERRILFYYPIYELLYKNLFYNR